MSTELKYLAFTALLTASLWIPYVVAQVITNGFLTPPNYVDPTPRPLPDWGKRADRTYINAVETFAPFAALVILIQLTSKADSMTAFWAIELLLDPGRTRRRLPGRHPLHPHDRFRARLCVRHRPLRRAGEVAAHPSLRGATRLRSLTERRRVCVRRRAEPKAEAATQPGKCWIAPARWAVP